MRHSTTPRKLHLLFLFGICSLVACKKPSDGANGGQSEAYKSIEKTFDESEPKAEERKPVQGADLSELTTPQEKATFEKLVDTLVSPCGKPHSLRTSRNTDQSCKRAPFAVKYVMELVKDGATDTDIKELYALRFKPAKAIPFNLTNEMPHAGPTDAPVKIAEFFDYGCPACQAMKPVLEEAIKGMETDVVLYFKHFPLAAHPDSVGAAQAAMAALKQGKFKEMHELLFKNLHDHKISDLTEYAKEIGLDMARYKTDFDAAKPLVEADKAEGEKAGIQGTPSIYINGILYEGPSHPKYLKMWLDEALAQAR